MGHPALVRLGGLFFALAALLQPAAGLATERTVRIDGGEQPIDGRLTEPAGAASAAVLLLHGFNGHMDEVGNLFADLADALARRGIASLRINFNGEGPQANYRVTSTFDSRLQQAQQASSYLRTAIPDAPGGVVGFSLGGLTTLALLGREGDAFRSVVLWSASDRMDLTGSSTYAAAAKAAILDGEAAVTTWIDTTLTRRFVASYIGVQVGGALARYQGSLLSIRGSEDFLPRQDPQWLAACPSTDKAFLLLGGADHTFNVLDEPRPGYGQRVIDATVAWLARTLPADAGQ